MGTKLQQIQDLTIGKDVKGFYQLTQMTRRTTRNREPYLDCVLQDQTGSVPGKWWAVPEAAFEWLSQGLIVAVTGKVDEYNERKQINIEQMTPAKESQVSGFGLTYADIVPTTEYDIDDMWKTIMEIIDSMENEHLQALVRKVYLDFEDEIKTHPGSVSHHHLYRGGFLEHVWSLTQVGELIADHYFELDRDLFLSGLFLHDIGKILEIKSDFERRYTDEGRFVGHIVLGRDIIRDLVRNQLPEFPDDLLMQIEHIILAHQDEHAGESGKRPATLEALVVSMLDRLDTRIYQFLDTLKTDPNTGDWTFPTSAFPYPLYKSPQDESE